MIGSGVQVGSAAKRPACVRLSACSAMGNGQINPSPMDATCSTADMLQNSVSCIAISGAGAATGAGTWRAGAIGAVARGATLAGGAMLGTAPSGISSGRGSHLVISKIGA